METLDLIEKEIDYLGRIVLPKSIRDCYGMALNDKVRLTPTDNGILITKSEEEYYKKRKEI